jgi:protein-L-isoaspartate(D-aspartate) O-methyltransferase
VSGAPPRRPRFPSSLAAPKPPPAAPAPVPARAAAGLGLDSQRVRARLVERLARSLGITDAALLRALNEIPRHEFIDPALATQAYEDTPLPIGHGQTISSPTIVARMIALLQGGANARARGNLGRTLEIGTGCGYQAAVLSRLASVVISIERLKPLHDKARELLAPWRDGNNLRLVYGDGRLGHPPNAPYDSIIAAAGGDDLPPAWLEQLAVGGRLVAPVASGRAQVLVVVDRTAHEWRREVHEAVMFVPLRSGIE